VLALAEAVESVTMIRLGGNMNLADLGRAISRAGPGAHFG
jgi:hypothetical protein